MLVWAKLDPCKSREIIRNCQCANRYCTKINIVSLLWYLSTPVWSVYIVWVSCKLPSWICTETNMFTTSRQVYKKYMYNMYIYDVLYHWIVKLGNETWMNSERTMLGCLSTISRPNISGCVPVSNGDRMYPEISHQSYQRVPAAFIELQFLQIHRIIWPSSRGVTSNTSNNLDQPKKPYTQA